MVINNKCNNNGKKYFNGMKSQRIKLFAGRNTESQYTDGKSGRRLKFTNQISVIQRTKYDNNQTELHKILLI